MAWRRRKGLTLRGFSWWFAGNTFTGGALGLIISHFLMGRASLQIILMGVLFGNVIGLTSVLSAKYILPLYRPLPAFLDISLRAVTLITGGLIGTVLVFLVDSDYFVLESSFVSFMIALGGLMALIIGMIIYSYEHMKTQLDQSHMEVEMRRDIEERLRELTAFSELQALKAQINPHFLFNTLNTIAALIPADQEKAEATVHDLADLFRYTLDTAERELVPLDDELRFIDQYLRIEKARFGERLRVEKEIDPKSRGARVPPLILQPIVENALRHGIGRRKTGGTIHIVATCDDDVCQVRISDDGPGIPAEKLEDALNSGRGLRNVNERLLNFYEEGGGVAIESSDGKGTTCTLHFPRTRTETKNETEDYHRR